MKLAAASVMVIAGLGLGPVAARSAAIGPDLVTNGEFAFTNGPGQLLPTITEAPPWHAISWQMGFIVADQGVPDPHELISLWDQKNTVGISGAINTWDGLSAHGGNFDALIDNTYAAAVSQVIRGLTVGKLYDVKFSYGFSEKHNFARPTVQSMTVNLGSSSWTSPSYSLPARGFSGWYDVTVQFKATATQETLLFQSFGSPVPGTIYHAFPIPVLSNVQMFADDGTPHGSKPTAVSGPIRVVKNRIGE